MAKVRDDWDFYYTRRGDVDASITVNLGLHSAAPDSKRSWRLTVRLQIQSPTPKGMNTAEERPKLDEIADALTGMIVANCDAVFVGRMVRGGFWTLTYYAPHPGDFLDSVDKTMKQFSGYPYGRGVREDPHWSVYLKNLIPNRREFQQILDRRIIENLKKHGDDLKTPREVRHWIYFKNPLDRGEFIDVMLRDGFGIYQSDLPDNGMRVRRFSVQLSRKETIEITPIHRLVLTLFDRAAEFEGEYDGWEAEVLKSAAK